MSIVGGRTPDRDSGVRELALPGAFAAMFVGLGLCWVLAAPAGPEAVAVPATAALGATVLLLGLGALPALGLDPSARLIGIAGAAWFASALLAAWVRTADQVGTSPVQVSIGQFADTLRAGAPELIALIVSALVVALAVIHVVGRIDPPVAVYAILAAIGLLATSITGHAGQHAIGPILVGAHALAAGWWCGTLAAMALTIRGRAGWASALPDFSTRALWAVALIAVTGVITGVTEVGGVDQLIETGYGRVLLAKVVGLAVLIALGARHRRRWVPAVARHRVTAVVSLRLAVGEVLMMAVVLGLATGLSTTAP